MALGWLTLLLSVSAHAQEGDAPATTQDDSAVEFTYSAEDLSLLELLSLEVVSASASAESVAQAPAVIDVITAEEIRRYGYRSLAEALESLPGLDLVHDHYQPSLGVRGVTSGQRGWSGSVKVMIDGQPIAFRPSGENFLGVEAIPLGVVERIEVIRGPGSVLYGANAFLGVVNIITKEGYRLEGGEIEGGYEGGEGQEIPWGGAVVGGDWEHFSLVASAAGESRRLFDYPLVALPGRDLPSDDSSQARARLSGSAFGRFSFHPDKHNVISLDGHFQTLNRDAEFIDWGPMAHENHIHLRNGYARLSYEGEWAQKIYWRLTGALAFGGTGENDRLNVAEGLRTYVERDLGYRGRDTDVSVRYELPGSSQMSVGVDSSIDTQELLAHYVVTQTGARVLNPPGNALTGEREFLRIGAYANSTLYPFELGGFRPLSSLGLTGGVRLDSQNLYGEDFNSRAGVVYDFEDQHYVKLLYGSSYRAPASTQLYSNYIEPGGIIGNPDLRPERARTYEVALGTSPFRGMTMRFNGYYTRIRDRVEIRQPSPSSPVANRQPVNSSPIDSYGGEATLDFRFSDYLLFANYSLQTSSYNKRNLLSIDAEIVGVHTAAYPSQMIKFGGVADFPDYFVRLALTGRYTGARLGTLDNNSLVQGRDYLTERYRLSPYILLDLSVSSIGLQWWGHRETRLMGKVRNLFDAAYAFPSYGGFDVPGFARTFEISLRQEL